jgi:hypothetical protein
MMASRNVGGKYPPLEHECITAAQLKHKNEQIRENDAGRNDGKMHRAA